MSRARLATAEVGAVEIVAVACVKQSHPGDSPAKRQRPDFLSSPSKQDATITSFDLGDVESQSLMKNNETDLVQPLEETPSMIFQEQKDTTEHQASREAILALDTAHPAVEPGLSGIDGISSEFGQRTDQVLLELLASSHEKDSISGELHTETHSDSGALAAVSTEPQGICIEDAREDAALPSENVSKIIDCAIQDYSPNFKQSSAGQSPIAAEKNHEPEAASEVSFLIDQSCALIAEQQPPKENVLDSEESENWLENISTSLTVADDILSSLPIKDTATESYLGDSALPPKPAISSYVMDDQSSPDDNKSKPHVADNVAFIDGDDSSNSIESGTLGLSFLINLASQDEYGSLDEKLRQEDDGKNLLSEDSTLLVRLRPSTSNCALTLNESNSTTGGNPSDLTDSRFPVENDRFQSLTDVILELPQATDNTVPGCSAALNPEMSESMHKSESAPTQSEPCVQQIRCATRFSDETIFLKEFLDRANARKAAKSFEVPVYIPADLTSPRRSPRKALAQISSNSPSMQEVQAPVICSGSPPGKEHLEGIDIDAAKQVAVESMSCRRSTRKRLFTPGKRTTAKKSNTALPTPSMIPVRRVDGADPVVLPESKAHDLAVVTRANTRRNKGRSKPPKLMLQRLAIDMDEVSVPARIDAKETKSVGWDATLVYYPDAAPSTGASETTRLPARRVRNLGGAHPTRAPSPVTLEAGGLTKPSASKRRGQK